jgi:signal transduction histidine kinase
MKPESLESHIRRLAFGWTVAGILLTLSLSGSLGLVLMFKDAERQIETLANAALLSDRTDILSGDVRSIELRLKKEFSVKDGETLTFLDEKMAPWVGDLRTARLSGCTSATHICREWLQQRIIVEKPIFFDEEGKHLWGYLHIEKSPDANWALVFSVALAVIAGMMFQGLGFYFNLVKAIKAVSGTLVSWAAKLSANPKDQTNYGAAPYSEIEPIGRALSGLRREIDALEKSARQQGALTTLRGVGHDILNPVSRMKRILGLLEMQSSPDKPLLLSMGSNLKRLSSYAEQLKLIYKRQNGETGESAPVLDVSREVRLLAEELLHDPESAEKRLSFQVEINEGCHARIPPPALGRIVENLCSNSIHASHEGGTILVKVCSEGDHVSISVADEGSGISEEHRDRIFEPDFSTKPNKGTGLGLFVVKQVCEQYGGRISFQTKPGTGTSFRIEFPKAEVKYDLQIALS